MNTIDRLVMMANQIAVNVETDVNPPAAVAEHIKQYWDPRMKSMLRASGVKGLSSTVLSAIKLLND